MVTLKIPSHVRIKWVLALIVISVTGMAAAATILFTHTFPAVPTVAAIITTTCSTLTLSPATVIVGTSGAELGQCNTPSPGSPAFTSSGATGSVTPTFALPTQYSALAIISHTTGLTCDTTSPGYTVISTGVAISSPTAGGYDYCASYSNAPSGTLPTFTVSWSQ